jgi:UDP-N-acetylglucosamine 1-carboxyvinyltransferase
MMAAVLADGTTTLKNCALEPEIVSVAEWLNSCGAKITGAGTSTMTIHGTAGKLLQAKSHPYEAIPDRIEAGSYLILGALSAKDLTIENCRPEHMEAPIQLLRNSGVNISVGSDGKSLVLKNDKSAHEFKPFNIRTHEYPGFPTDLQSPMVTFLSQVSGESTVLETIFEGRFKFTEDLTKLGANITIMNPREIIVRGPTAFGELRDGDVLQAHDIRAGFAVVIAAILAKGTCRVSNVHYIDRGYAKIEEKLRGIGVKIERKAE